MRAIIILAVAAVLGFFGYQMGVNGKTFSEATAGLTGAATGAVEGAADMAGDAVEGATDVVADTAAGLSGAVVAVGSLSCCGSVVRLGAGVLSGALSAPGWWNMPNRPPPLPPALLLLLSAIVVCSGAVGSSCDTEDSVRLGAGCRPDAPPDSAWNIPLNKPPPPLLLRLLLSLLFVVVDGAWGGTVATVAVGGAARGVVMVASVLVVLLGATGRFHSRIGSTAVVGFVVVVRSGTVLGATRCSGATGVGVFWRGGGGGFCCWVVGAGTGGCGSLDKAPSTPAITCKACFRKAAAVETVANSDCSAWSYTVLPLWDDDGGGAEGSAGESASSTPAMTCKACLRKAAASETAANSDCSAVS